MDFSMINVDQICHHYVRTILIKRSRRCNLTNCKIHKQTRLNENMRPSSEMRIEIMTYKAKKNDLHYETST